MPTFDTPEPVSAVIALQAGDVRFVASERADTVVAVSPSDRSEDADVRAAEQTRVELSLGRLLVKAPKQRWRASPFAAVGSVDVVIELPAGSDVQGEAAIADFRANGRLGACRLKTASGHIWLDQTGPAQLTATDGDMVGIREGTAGWLDVRSQFGSVRNSLDAADGPGSAVETLELRARTASGDVVIRRS